MQPVTVRSIHIYPVKSARGIAVETATVTDRGFAHDRRFMVVDDAGEFLTQRRHPAMALIDVRIHARDLILSAPGAGSARVPLSLPAGERRVVRVWGDSVEAIWAGAEASDLLRRYLDTPCELVYMPDETIRLVDPDDPIASDRVGFADRYPFLLLSEASVDDLNERIAARLGDRYLGPLPMDRFRPNLVVSGCGPYAEDCWDDLLIGDVLFHVAKPCSRCSIVTVDQRTGFEGKEPLATLATYRKQGGGVVFGQNLIHRGHGVIRVGDPVRPVR